MRGIHRSSVNSPHKGQWRGALMFSLICTWINGWANNREAGDLRPHSAHYDVTVMRRHRPTLLLERLSWYQCKGVDVDPSYPNAAYMHAWIGSALVQIMACRLFGAKPLSKPLLGYCQLNPCKQTVDPSYPNAAYMHAWIGSALVQIMACRLFGAKPLSKPLLGYCQLDPCKQT